MSAGDPSPRMVAPLKRVLLAAAHAVELLDDDFLLSDELVDDERGLPLRPAR